MAVLNVRVAGPTLLTNVAATIYTSPPGTVTLVQHLHVANNSNVAQLFGMSLGLFATPGNQLFPLVSIAAGQVLERFVKYTLQPGELLQALGGNTNVLVIQLDGQQLTAG